MGKTFSTQWKNRSLTLDVTARLIDIATDGNQVKGNLKKILAITIILTVTKKN
jgi:hypothetical protein